MEQFNFNISLSVLNHLGRNLYRNFITVIGEAVSNSWDSDANNVWIEVDREANIFIIKDDGIGMTNDDFQNKFLKIGYTKRKDGILKSPQGRPYIGRKGIGKLALLSCAKKIHITTKTKNSDYIGGVIDNDRLDKDIQDDLTAQDSKLGTIDDNVFSNYKEDHTQGTIIYFEDINDGIKNKLDYIKTLIALYFRFSLVDKNFNIFLNKNKITVKELEKLASNTEFLWNINSIEDPYISILKNLKEQENIPSDLDIKGFIASVEKPSGLNMRTSDEKTGIDLFVNGRLRERNILHHTPDFVTRHVASYLYGQIHFNQLDDAEDRFTTARESVKEGDTEYKKLIDNLKVMLNTISSQWDEWRIKHKQDGDIENPRVSKKQRQVKSLINTVFQEYAPPQDSKNKDKVDEWVNRLSNDAEFNIPSYIDCFISENLIRKYIDSKEIESTSKASSDIKKYRKIEETHKREADININIRKNNKDTSYLDMDGLANLVDKNKNYRGSLSNKANEYKPVRNAMAHTAQLTEEAKTHLTSTFNDIKGRLKTLLNGEK